MIKSIILDQVDKIKQSNVVDKNILENSELETDINNLISEKFKIAVIVPWGAGKTTLINSLIGKDILKQYGIYYNVLITRVKFSNEIKLELIYKERDNVEIIDKDESGNLLNEEQLNKMLEYKTIVKDKNNEEAIKEIIIHHPIDTFKCNTEFIDTQDLFCYLKSMKS